MSRTYLWKTRVGHFHRADKSDADLGPGDNKFDATKARVGNSHVFVLLNARRFHMLPPSAGERATFNICRDIVFVDAVSSVIALEKLLPTCINNATAATATSTGRRIVLIFIHGS